jgi:Phytanoyl-CoA dioxygenase (PhyH)
VRDVTDADRLVTDGRVVEAVDVLAAAYRRDPEPALAIRLIDLRQEATRALEPGPGRSPWPPSYDDPFPHVSGKLPEIDVADLTPDVLGGAVAHHGALVVRRLFDGGQVSRSVEAIHTAQTWRDTDKRGADKAGDAWYRPFPCTERRDRVLRGMVAKGGGLWLADSPASAAQVLDDLASTCVIDVITSHLAERPFFSLQKSTLRRTAPIENLVAWHQDGSFLDAGVRAVNVWVALSRCGGDHPSPGLEVIPRRIGEILPVEAVVYPNAISFDLVEEIASETPTVRPEFGPGDALLFDELFLHRTHLSAFMTEDRYALECWFFAPSHHSTGYIPFLA